MTSVTPQPCSTSHRYCSSSALERSLYNFDLGKLDGSPLEWPLWIGRFKSIVHNQPFLHDNQCLTYLQNAVNGPEKSEIQFLGEVIFLEFVSLSRSAIILVYGGLQRLPSGVGGVYRIS